MKINRLKSSILNSIQANCTIFKAYKIILDEYTFKIIFIQNIKLQELSKMSNTQLYKQLMNLNF